MPNIEDLRLVVGELMQVPGESIAGTTVLNGVLSTSLGRARLDAALRARLNIANPAVYTLKTFGELCQISGIAVSEAEGGAPVHSRDIRMPADLESQKAGVAIGVDLQSVDALPDENDFWEGEFYKQHFTGQEIAYALLQPEPRESFAGAWCAKEALRKADNRWLDVDWKQTEIVHDASGKPALRSGEQEIPCSLSLSHANGFAIAVVVIGEKRQVEPAMQVTTISPMAEAPAQRTGGRLPLLLAVLALLLSIVTAGFEFLK